MSSYRTIAGPFDWEAEPIKGSRFHAWVAPAADEAGAGRAVAEAVARWPDASHHCWAWRLTDGATRSFDDGEPRGSAGRPILAQLGGHELHNLAVVVARWFGGTKLGVGGLVRAYGGTAGKALDRAEVVVVPHTVDLLVEHAYDDTHAVQGVLAHHAVQVVDTAFDVAVRLHLRLPAAEADAFATALRDRTAGRVAASPR